MLGHGAATASQLKAELGAPAPLETIVRSHRTRAACLRITAVHVSIHVPQPDLVGRLEGMRRREAYIRRETEKSLYEEKPS